MDKLLNKFQLSILFLIVMIFLSFSLIFSNFNYMKYGLLKNQQLYVVLKKSNPSVTTLSSDSTNSVPLIANVVNSNGEPVGGINLKIFEKDNFGTFYSGSGITDRSGNSLFLYNPPDLKGDFAQKDIEIIAKIKLSGRTDSVKFKLSHVPIIFVHGYQEYSSLFDGMKSYFETKGFDTSSIDYESKNGVLESSEKLKQFMDERKKSYMGNGFQINKFDLVSHSMGGLISRIYTCSGEYLQKRNDVRKIVFISVPHQGSPWAPIAAKYLNDNGIRDLSSSNKFLSETLPKAYNQGLNPRIQTGNILAQFDEVVLESSAKLEEWDIKTEVFNVGENSSNVNNLLSGNLLDAPNHRNILYNKTVFYKIFEMLTTDIKYPSEVESK